MWRPVAFALESLLGLAAILTDGECVRDRRIGRPRDESLSAQVAWSIQQHVGIEAGTTHLALRGGSTFPPAIASRR